MKPRKTVEHIPPGPLPQQALARAKPKKPQKSPNLQCGCPCQRRTASGGQGCQEQIAAPIAAPVVAAVGVAAAMHMQRGRHAQMCRYPPSSSPESIGKWSNLSLGAPELQPVHFLNRVLEEMHAFLAWELLSSNRCPFSTEPSRKSMH